jgi:hypothetical protein
VPFANCHLALKAKGPWFPRAPPDEESYVALAFMMATLHMTKTKALYVSSHDVSSWRKLRLYKRQREDFPAKDPRQGKIGII